MYIGNVYFGIGRSGKDVHQSVQSKLSLTQRNSHDVNNNFCLLIHILSFFIKQILLLLQKVMEKINISMKLSVVALKYV